MDIIQNSQDVLNIVKAISLGAIAFFVCWGMYYFAMILRQGYLIFKGMRGRMHKVDDFFRTIKEKLEHHTSYLLLIGEGIKKLVELTKGKEEKKKTRKTKVKK